MPSQMSLSHKVLYSISCSSVHRCCASDGSVGRDRVFSSCELPASGACDARAGRAHKRKQESGGREMKEEAGD
eukprot:1819690-Rhodomonas_salina.1